MMYDSDEATPLEFLSTPDSRVMLISPLDLIDVVAIELFCKVYISVL